MKHFTLLLMTFFWSFFLFGQCSVQGIYLNSFLVDPNSATNNFDTDGDGTANDRDEFLQFCNDSSAIIYLSSFTISDLVGLKYSFSSNDSILPGECITIITDWLNTSAMPSYFREISSTAIWNNAGDSILFSDGTTTCAVSYGSYGSTPEQDGCATVNIFDSAYVNCSLIPANLGNLPLPVHFIDFSGQPNNGNILLNWKTASEINNHYFAIERSTDGFSFAEIGEVLGYGNSYQTRSYSYIDLFPKLGSNLYRLKQVDFDGSRRYSNVVEIKNIQNITFIDQGKELKVSLKDREEAMCRVLDSNGQELKSTNIFESTTINKNDYGSGLYYILIYSNGTVYSHKLVIL